MYQKKMGKDPIFESVRIVIFSLNGAKQAEEPNQELAAATAPVDDEAGGQPSGVIIPLETILARLDLLDKERKRGFI